ncbi:glycoside hydrolase family 2 TIM barrel-domain containing protein [Changchengzhania lutea]|uniref:glycoside hydrolase family 2 TIM barrel-domain containing protein n=1 Tax=Changchengzhania lutea TaxID=2049305 RepID=UPI00115D6389|nr:glycoside hydrolase family 2 TIM barrel-domain containing protein [Changchengzhania lutea]
MLKFKTTFKTSCTVLVLMCIMFSFEIMAQKSTINSGWQFTLNDKSSSDWETINIPHTWNKEDAFDDIRGYYRGIGWYKKTLFFSKDGEDLEHYLHFKGVNQETDVFFNGNLVGNHKGGYTVFNFNITELIKFDAYNLIEVKVDNSHNENIPPLDADFTFYGGIYRDVQLISKPKQHISLSDFASSGFYVDYYHVSEEKAGIEIKILIDNFENKPSNNKVKVIISDAENKIVYTKTLDFQSSAKASEALNMKLSEVYNPKLWSPENPYLYKLHISLLDRDNNLLDKRRQNIAFRWVSVDANKGFFLNGKPYKLVGVNRHQDYEGFGNAVPMHLQEKDIHLIKNMGANVIRFAHYPHSQDLYKLCDELGILVWSEIPIVNKVTNTKAFFDTCLKVQEEHLKQYYNYPSVVMFGYMNEIFLRQAFDNTSTKAEKETSKIYTYELAKLLEDFTRKHAPNRITVMALHFNELYNETKIADLSMLIGWNLYFGWYHDTIEDLGIFLDDQHKRYPNRCIMVSEYGPGADVRISANPPIKYDYSQDYQLKLHTSYHQQVMDRDFVAGMTAWDFADFGSEFRGETIPHVNQKGLVQYNREPKEVYYWYKSVLNKKNPFVHIALDHKEELILINQSEQNITFFSNQDKGKLYVNNVFFQDVIFSNGMANIAISFVKGKTKLRIETDSGFDEKIIRVNSIQNLKTDPITVLAINTGTPINFVDSESGITFLGDRAYSENLYGYVTNTSGNCLQKLIPNNVKNTHLEAVFQTILEDCSTYKVDIPNGNYKVTLYFVEPQLKGNMDIIYNLNTDEKTETSDISRRIFDIFLNDQLVAGHFDMANEYPEKYGITKSSTLNINDDSGLTISFIPIEGKPVLSGILIEKTF